MHRLVAMMLSAAIPVLDAAQLNWGSFLARSDPVNAFRVAEPATLPDVWLEASFAGNGMIGTQAMVCPGGVCRQSLLPGSNSTLPAPAPLQVVLPLARGDVSDIRSGKDSVVCTEWHGVTTCAGDVHNSQPKLGIGALVLSRTRGAIVSGVITTRLHNATLSVSVNTTVGAVSFVVWVHATRQVVTIEGLAGSGGEDAAALHWDFRPAPALPPGLFREFRGADNFTTTVGSSLVCEGACRLPRPDMQYKPNPAANCSGSPAAGSCRQSLLVSPEGRGWVTSWRGAGAGRIIVAITSDIPIRVGIKAKGVRALAEAKAVLDAAVALEPTALASEHVSWWRDFWWSSSSGSFISLPAAAAQVEQFHFIQAYKIGSENGCRRFVDSAFPLGVVDNCMLTDGLNFIGPMQKTKYPFA